ncbi:MAG: HAMP domain-containing protein, partial [Pseudomonadales bacterium]|nr:HAMP domain-containing protein [Pseudomonadales bacterium]
MSMLRSRFLWQLCAAIAAIILISTLAFSFVASNQVQEDARDNIRESLQVQATILSHLLVPTIRDGVTLSGAELNRITGDADTRITVIRADGLVLADNREDPSEMDNHAHRPEVLRARTRGVGVSERYSQTVQHNMLYVAVRAESEGEYPGYVRVALPLRSVEQQLAGLRNRIFLTGFMIAGIFLIVGFLMARKFTLPLVRMTEGATQIARGNYDLRLPEDRRDEIGDLARALNRLARDTRNRFEELTDSRNQLAAVLSGLTEGVIAVDLNQRVVHINDAAKEMLRIEKTGTVGQPFWEIVKIAEMQQAMDTCLDEGTTVKTTVSVNKRTMDLSVVLLRGENGTSPAGAIMVLHEITELLRLEQVRSDFVANASHELKTPISAIRGMVETIIDDSGMEPEVLRQFIERVRNQASRLDNIVQDLLRLSRFDTYAGEMSFTRLELRAIMQREY